MKFQKVGAVFGLAGGLLVIASVTLQSVGTTSLTELKPEAIVQWCVENQHHLFYQPLMMLAMMFFGVLLQAVEARIKPAAPNAAILGSRFGWMTVLLLTLMLLAQWFHIFLNAVVWERDIAVQFARLTFNSVTFFDLAAQPFLIGWLITTGIGGAAAGAFSKWLSWVTVAAGGILTLAWFGELWQTVLAVPLAPYLQWIAPYTYFLLIWFSLELLFRSRSEQRGAADASAGA